jgi:5'-methylthioadenosine phosphorylase
MGLIGIIAGTVFLQEKGIFSGWEERIVENEYGRARVFLSPGAILIPRHGNDPRSHILPHEINHRANLRALKDLGTREVISVNSTGSLKTSIKPGMMVVPDDFILLAGPPGTIQSRPVHLTPGFSEEVRKRWIRAAREVGVDVITSGTYWQTTGPRLETRAEIRMMAQFADLVGMTMASEAVIAQELGLPYGALCSADNYANGLADTPLTMEEILEHSRKNSEKARTITEAYIELFASEGP